MNHQKTTDDLMSGAITLLERYYLLSQDKESCINDINNISRRILTKFEHLKYPPEFKFFCEETYSFKDWENITQPVRNSWQLWLEAKRTNSSIHESWDDDEDFLRYSRVYFGWYSVDENNKYQTAAWNLWQHAKKYYNNIANMTSSK